MRVLFAGAECVPFFKTGGLGDVLGSLPNQLAKEGVDVGVVHPLYQDLPEKINWMEDGLFVFMAPGYVLLAWSVWQTVRSVRGMKTFHAWMAPAIFIALMFAGSIYLFTSDPASPAWERVLLSVMVLATVVTGVLLIVFGFRQKMPMAGWLFILNLVGIFLLNGLARMPEQTIVLQWVEESINTISWLAFMFAASKVYEYTRANFGVDTPIALKVSPV